MARSKAPYTAGDRLELMLPDGPRTVVVGAIVGISAPDPHRRWRLLCRDEVTGGSIDLPVYCGDDGEGELFRRDDPTPARVAQPS